MEHSHDELLGQTLNNRYVLDKLLGTGGMGAVYRARRIDTDESVAIKVLRHELGADVKQLKRLEREARVASSLHHGNIVRALELSIETVPFAFMVMEYVEGESLQELIDRGELLSPPRAVRVGRQLLGALAEAHSAGVIHRDVKPANIMLTVVGGIGEFVKLLDFGIAKMLEGEAATKLTETGVTIGTPHYMPPEQVLGHDVDHRADLYATGVVLFEVLSGELPFVFDGLRDFVVKVTTEEPRSLAEVAPDLPLKLVEVIDTALQPSADDRFQSASEMADALTASLRDRVEAIEEPRQSPRPHPHELPSKAPPPVASPHPESHETLPARSSSSSTTRRPPIALFLGVIVLICVVIGVGIVVGRKLFTFTLGSSQQQSQAVEHSSSRDPQKLHHSSPDPPLVPAQGSKRDGSPSRSVDEGDTMTLVSGFYGPMTCGSGTRVLEKATISASGAHALHLDGSCKLTMIDSKVIGAFAIVAKGKSVLRIINSTLVGEDWGIEAIEDADVMVDGGTIRGATGAAFIADNAVLRTSKRTELVGKVLLRDKASHHWFFSKL